jgi:hypothetical protein
MEGPFPEPSAELTRKVAHRSLSLALKRRQGGIKRYEVDITMQLGRLIRDTRAKLCISMKTFSERTSLDPELLFFLESGLASSQEVSQTFPAVRNVLGLKCADVAQVILAKEGLFTRLRMRTVMKSLGLTCSDVAKGPMEKPTLNLGVSMEYEGNSTTIS